MKTIVTHLSPDLDAITSTWLVKRYLPGWASAEHAFVPAGETLNKVDPDSNSDIIHVDTGLGKFDHHQSSKRSSATKKVFDFLLTEGHIKDRDSEALEKMVKYVTEIDNFGEVNFPDPTDIKYSFSLNEFLFPLRGNLSSDTELVNLAILILDSILFSVKSSLKAEKEIKEGIVLTTSLGKVLVMETQNEVAIKQALKKGFEIVARKDPIKGTIRVKTQPDEKYDLTQLYNIVLDKDKKATWFLHASKHMLLNGSSKNPNSIPSSLSLKQLIEILRKM